MRFSREKSQYYDYNSQAEEYIDRKLYNLTQIAYTFNQQKRKPCKVHIDFIETLSKTKLPRLRFDSFKIEGMGHPERFPVTLSSHLFH